MHRMRSPGAREPGLGTYNQFLRGEGLTEWRPREAADAVAVRVHIGGDFDAVDHRLIPEVEHFPCSPAVQLSSARGPIGNPPFAWRLRSREEALAHPLGDECVGAGDDRTDDPLAAAYMMAAAVPVPAVLNRIALDPGTPRCAAGLSEPTCSQSRNVYMDDPLAFRREAEECRRQAALSIDPLTKAFWLELPQSWERMAETASERNPFRLGH